jgi:hypothetical protein
VAVSPAPFATSVSSEHPGIWVQFGSPLDPSTIDARHVFLKLDTQRIPVTVHLSPSGSRIDIVPDTTLKLLRTYTVELSPEVRGADGVSLGKTFSWQFKTGSLHLPVSLYPQNGASAISPFTSLSWGGNETTAGGKNYLLYAGTDSSVVARHLTAPLATGQAPLYVPHARWNEGGLTWWSVTVVNTSTGEQVDGPVWRFETVDLASMEVDSLVVPHAISGYVQITDRRRSSCVGAELVSGPLRTTCAVTWNLSVVAPETHVFGARIDLSTTTAYSDSITGGESAWLVTAFWLCNQMNVPGPPFTDEVNGELAIAERVGARGLRYASDALSAHVEATLRNPGLFFGYLFRSPETLHYVGAASPEPLGPRMVLYTYRVNPVAYAHANNGRRRHSIRR